MTKIALFGTSADPPTIAHQHILSWLADHYDLVAVYASDNPFKQHLASLQQRGEMLQLLIEEIDSPKDNLKLCQAISDRRSLNTLAKARQKWGEQVEFTLVIGSDLLTQLQSWYRVKELLQEVKLLVMPRPNYPIEVRDLQLLEQIGAQFQVAQICLPSVSSTGYRQEREKNAVTVKVKNYIQEQQLYLMARKGIDIDKDDIDIDKINKIDLADFRVGVDNIIFSVDTQHNRLLVLLVKREDQPFLNYWSLPGTLVRRGESLEDAAHRILAEKIRVSNLYLEQLYTFGGPNRDPRESADSFGVRYLSVSYFALVRYEEAEISQALKGATWKTLDNIPPLAFDHNQILQYGYHRLRNKLEYSPIAFDVLPEVFTLNDLYQFYTTVLGENFADYSNFRSRLLKLGFLADTGIKVSKGAGRPASLYRFDAQAFAPLKDKPLVFI